MNDHLTLQQMLAFLDGELPRLETRKVEDHLHSCWTCRSAAERLKGDIGTILDALNERFSPALPPPPLPWPSFNTLLARSAPPPPSMRSRITAYMSSLLRPRSSSRRDERDCRSFDIRLFNLPVEACFRPGNFATGTNR